MSFLLHTRRLENGRERKDRHRTTWNYFSFINFLRFVFGRSAPLTSVVTFQEAILLGTIIISAFDHAIILIPEIFNSSVVLIWWILIAEARGMFGDVMLFGVRVLASDFFLSVDFHSWKRSAVEERKRLETTFSVASKQIGGAYD